MNLRGVDQIEMMIREVEFGQVADVEIRQPTGCAASRVHSPISTPCASQPRFWACSKKYPACAGVVQQPPPSREHRLQPTQRLVIRLDDRWRCEPRIELDRGLAVLLLVELVEIFVATTRVNINMFTFLARNQVEAVQFAHRPALGRTAQCTFHVSQVPATHLDTSLSGVERGRPPRVSVHQSGAHEGRPTTQWDRAWSSRS